MKHTLSVLVEDESGALSRISGLIARRGFNIDSLTVGPTQTQGQSRLTMVVGGDDQALQQITKQLDKLVNVLQVVDLTKQPAVERELMLLKVAAPAGKRSAIRTFGNAAPAEKIWTNVIWPELLLPPARDVTHFIRDRVG